MEGGWVDDRQTDAENESKQEGKGRLAGLLVVTSTHYLRDQTILSGPLFFSGTNHGSCVKGHYINNQTLSPARNINECAVLTLFLVCVFLLLATTHNLSLLQESFSNDT